MPSHRSLLELSAAHRLTPDERCRLFQLAGQDGDPIGLRHKLAHGMTIAGAAFVGLGLIFWLAANWGALSRFQQFALLQLLILAVAAIGWLRPRARPGCGVLTFLATGGLFAFFGQTYQTGADPWQLFALWAVLALPLCFGARHDALWVCWTLVAVTGISLWVDASRGNEWFGPRDDLGYHLIGWAAVAGLVVLFSHPVMRKHGVGMWTLRIAAVLAAAMVTSMALMTRYRWPDIPLILSGIAVLSCIGVALARSSRFDVFSLSIVVLGLNVMGAFTLGYLFLHDNSTFMFGLFLTGVLSACMLGASVKLILHLSKASMEGADA